MTEFSPFSCPIFLGHPEASGFCFQSERLLYGRGPSGVKGGTGKAKAAKLQGAGIIPKLCPMERVGTEVMHRNGSRHANEARNHRRKGDKRVVLRWNLRTWCLLE